jgi:hypothetical protein
MEESLPHQAMVFGFAAETRDPLARNQLDLRVKHGRQPLLGTATDCRGRQALGKGAWTSSRSHSSALESEVGRDENGDRCFLYRHAIRPSRYAFASM